MAQKAISDVAGKPLSQWYLLARVVGMSLILLGAVFYQFTGAHSSKSLHVNLLYGLIALSYLQALVAALMIKAGWKTSYLAELQIIWDLLLAGLLVWLTGGANSFFSFVFLLVVLSSSLFLSRQNTITVAVFAASVYVVVVWGHAQYSPFEAIDKGSFFLTVVLHCLAFLLTGFLSGTLSERWRQSQTALQRKAVDYEDLERLNRTILSNISSGLMMINADGRIRSFNRAARKITGLPIEQVYDQPYTHFFPGLMLTDSKGRGVARKEMSFVYQDVEDKCLGYASTVIEDASDGASLLVTFQDLTEVKTLEQRLMVADRLAAVGQFASGMAHEIRNPLASISGSVQLLLEREELSDQGRRLMNIVEREANRLSGLLGEFLAYARPATPTLETINISVILDELLDLVSAETRDKQISVVRDYDSVCKMHVDGQQFRQALWNLIVNARDSIVNQGSIRVSVKDDRAVLVEDSGPGIAESHRNKIFDPFFTTKDRGSGLGLALVHSIMQAHRGSIELVESRLGGAAFYLQFSEPVMHVQSPMQ